MQIVEFSYNHMEEAMRIAMINYEEERKLVPALPKVDHLPDLKHFVENHLGCAAMEEGKLIGFLGTWSPRQDAFGTTNVKGTFSPIHAHGVIGVNRGRIYSRLYEAAADRWVKDGILSHAIALYTHDQEAVNSFFYQGFGLRCMDLIRDMKSVPTISKVTCEFCEVARGEWGRLLDLSNALIKHMGRSPIFMKFPLATEEAFLDHHSEDIRYFAAKADGKYIAYIKIGAEGENFATLDSDMMNICGAYCLPEYRGTGIYNDLLSYLITVLNNEGYSRLGVDCESFNPNARGFWCKHFTEYTHSVVRRIDDKAIAEVSHEL